MDPDLKREAHLFEQARSLAAAEQAEFLARECGAEAALRARVAALLAADEAAQGGFLDPLVLGEPAPANSRAEQAGDRIGRYKLLEKIGEGGWGVVWMAEQDEPLRRRVALKVIKRGMDTRELIARFEGERQALALMDHPNIAHVFDAGATAAGRPFFAMELVRGTKITTFCDEHALPTAARLDLFIQVCHAVQHAHQKGIIHRDLKPSNILVAWQDGAAVPKVIDFGIAKATQGRPLDGALLAAFAQFVGTPVYMSPEQAEPSNQDVDTRSDIYSLGVLLYELLTGHPPYDPEALGRAGLDEMRRVLRETDPPRPSARLRALEAEALAATAQRRATAPPRLIHSVRGDLDWIAMRCLEKDRRRRYTAASALAEDLGRYLRREPVQARPHTVRYVLGRFARRHRAWMLGGATVLGVLLAGVAVSTVLAVRATRAEQRAQEMLRVFQRVLDGLGQTAALGPDTNLERSAAEWRALLDRVATETTAGWRGQPEAEAELRHLLGKVYWASGEFPKAEAMLRSALALHRAHQGATHPEAMQTLVDLALVVCAVHRFEEAEAMLAEALAWQRDRAGADAPESVRLLELRAFVTWLRGDAVTAEPWFREAVERRRRTGRLTQIDNLHKSPLEGLTLCVLSTDRFAEGEQLARENLETVERQPGVAPRLVVEANQLVAWALNGQGRCDEALPFCRRAVDLCRREMDADHPLLSHACFELAACLDHRGIAAEQPEAEQLYRESVAIWRRSRATREPNNLIYRLTSFAAFLAKQDRRDEAEPYYAEAWQLLESCDRPTCVRCAAETLRDAVRFYRDWARHDPEKGADAALWAARLERFEGVTLAESPGAHRTNAVRGLARAYRLWAETEPAQAERAAFWAAELARSAPPQPQPTPPVAGAAAPEHP